MGFGKDGTGTIIRELITDGALGALATKDVVAFAGPTIIEDFRILKSELQVEVNIITSGQAHGLIFGIANGELSAAEIEEAIEVNGPLDRNDRVNDERSLRNVRTLGVLTERDPAAVSGMVRNAEDGTLLVSKHRWTYSNPEGWQWWIYNLGNTMTTGALLQLKASHYGVWVT